MDSSLRKFHSFTTMSQYIVSARKYRPRNFDEVVGQEQVTATLRRAIETDHLAQAFLFCGPRGVGKTTTARILAKAVNAGRTTDLHEVEDDYAFNIFELDAAANNSVEDIRMLTEKVRIPPQAGAYKVYIIDEVHMLSQQAFNAFLKTLEEPPPYAIFILATTEKHKILPTILSRCQIFDFRRIAVPDIAAHLRTIAEKEDVTVDDDALHIIAEKADGALRDALSIFDRLVSASGGALRYDDVISHLNVLDHDHFFRVMEAILARDVAGVYLIFDEVLRAGFEGSHFIAGLSEHVRNLLMCKDPRTLNLLEVSDGLRERYQETAGLAPTGLLINMLHLTGECDARYALAQNKRLLVETTLTKLCFLQQMVTGEWMERKATEKKKSEPEPPVTPAAGPPATPEPTDEDGPDDAKEPSPPPAADRPIDKTPADAPPGETSAAEAPSTSSSPLSLDALRDSVRREQASAPEDSGGEKTTDEPVTGDRVLAAWQDVATFFEKRSEDGLAQILRDVGTDWDGDALVLTFDSATERSLVEAKDGSIKAFFRTAIGGVPTLRLDVDETSTPKRIIKRPREQFEELAERNPSIRRLKDQLGLDFDH